LVVLAAGEAEASGGGFSSAVEGGAGGWAGRVDWLGDADGVRIAGAGDRGGAVGPAYMRSGAGGAGEGEGGRVTAPLPGSRSGSRSSSALYERADHPLRYAICSPVVESTRSAASISEVSNIAPSVSLAARRSMPASG